MRYKEYVAVYTFPPAPEGNIFVYKSNHRAKSKENLADFMRSFQEEKEHEFGSNGEHFLCSVLRKRVKFGG